MPTDQRQARPRPPTSSIAPAFPPGTRIADMTAPQAAAYWKRQSRRHEQRELDHLDQLRQALERLRRNRHDAARHQLELYFSDPSPEHTDKETQR